MSKLCPSCSECPHLEEYRTQQLLERRAAIVAIEEERIKASIARIIKLGGTTYAWGRRLKVETIKSAPPTKVETI